MNPHFSPGRLAQIACLLEATARKPGNVHRFRDFDDSDFLDFALSAQAIGPALDCAAAVGVGQTVLAAVTATQRVVATNTNLGMILLLAPLAAVPPDRPFREGVEDVLSATTVDDSRFVYAAIRQAQPGGIGVAPEQDVASEPTRALREVMALAAHRDAVARQYANGFAEVLGLAAPALARSLAQGRPLETAIVATHLHLLAEVPDTLIARKRGQAAAAEASTRAAEVLAEGWPDTQRGLVHGERLDDWLRADGHARNPGATADLVTAALFAGLRDGTIGLPLRSADWTAASGVSLAARLTPSADRQGPHHVPGSRYKVRVSKDYLVFCSGHFITYAGDKCERIHGHNYRVAVEVEDDLDENHYVFDFIALKDLTRAITDEIDHRMLLPTRSTLITLTEDGPNWLVRYGDRRWSFPRDECALLPIANTTAELLAGYIADRLRQSIIDQGMTPPRRVAVEVEESFGQSARVDRDWESVSPPGAGR